LHYSQNTLYIFAISALSFLSQIQIFAEYKAPLFERRGVSRKKFTSKLQKESLLG